MSTFLSDYREYCSNLEVPPSFTTFSSLVTLAALLRRRVWIYKGDYIRIYPNLYVVLVGPPGCGKNTAIEISEDVMHLRQLPLSAESVTREKLIMDIQAQESVLDFMPADDKYRLASPYTILATELSEFLGAGGVGMISFLTDIYSRNIYEYRTKNKGSTFVRGPYLNIVAGTTPDWITNYLKDDIISGGFSRRCIFVYETGRIDGDAFPRITPKMHEAWQRVMARSEAISKLSGPFVWHPSAEAFFRAWYPKRRLARDVNLTGYYETKDIQLLKVAMLVAVSDGNELVLKEEHLVRGLELLGLAETNLARVFQGIGRNELNQVSVKAMDILVNSPKKQIQLADSSCVEVPCLPLKQLKAMLWKDANGMDMDNVLKYLKDTDKVATCVDSSSGIPREYIFVKQSI